MSLYRFQEPEPTPVFMEQVRIVDDPQPNVYGRVCYKDPSTGIIIRVAGFTVPLWSVYRGEKMILTTYKREALARYVEDGCKMDAVLSTEAEKNVTACRWKDSN